MIVYFEYGLGEADGGSLSRHDPDAAKRCVLCCKGNEGWKREKRKERCGGSAGSSSLFGAVELRGLVSMNYESQL